MCTTPRIFPVLPVHLQSAIFGTKSNAICTLLSLKFSERDTNIWFHKMIQSGNRTVNNKIKSQTLATLRNSSFPEGPAQVESKSILQDTGAWLAAPWTPRRMCIRPAVPFSHLRLDALSLPPQKEGWHLSKTIFHFLFSIFKYPRSEIV